MRNFKPKKPEYFVQSLAKGLLVLQTLVEAGGTLSLSEIANSIKMNKTVVTRLCYTLNELGFLSRDEQKRYHLTPDVLTLGFPVVSRLEWHKIGMFYLNRLFEEINETVNLSALKGQQIQYLIRIRRENYMPIDIPVGTMFPVYCTAMGKILMAMGAPNKISKIIENIVFKPITTFTITRLEKFKEDLETVRQKGYAVNDEEFSLGNRAIAAPILDTDGNAVAAINIVVPTSRYTRHEMEKKLASPVMATGRIISEALRKIESPSVISKTGKKSNEKQE